MVQLINSLCYLLCLFSLAAWVVLSGMLIWSDIIWSDLNASARWRSADVSHLSRAWLTCQVVFISSALTLQLNKTYFDNRPGQSN
jgi:thiosulfate reductase cytochrome b subunit